jgi:hypothetical protein
LYDTQHLLPFSFISNLHYATLTDVAWTSDGLSLIMASADGFCSLVEYNLEEFGTVYVEPVVVEEKVVVEAEVVGSESGSAEFESPLVESAMNGIAVDGIAVTADGVVVEEKMSAVKDSGAAEVKVEAAVVQTVNGDAMEVTPTPTDEQQPQEEGMSNPITLGEAIDVPADVQMAVSEDKAACDVVLEHDMDTKMQIDVVEQSIDTTLELRKDEQGDVGASMEVEEEAINLEFADMPAVPSVSMPKAESVIKQNAVNVSVCPSPKRVTDLAAETLDFSSENEMIGETAESGVKLTNSAKPALGELQQTAKIEEGLATLKSTPALEKAQQAKEKKRIAPTFLGIN